LIGIGFAFQQIK